MLRNVFWKKLGVSMIACALLTGCGNLPAGSGSEGSGGAAAVQTPSPEPAATAKPVETAEPAATASPDEAADTVVSTEGMEIGKYLETYGVEEYNSEYLHLKAVEGICYVPTTNNIEIYRDNIFCGWVYAYKFYREDWCTDPQFVRGQFGGPRTTYEMQDIPQGLDTSRLAMLFECDDELYGQPAKIEWLLEKGYFRDEDEIAKRSTVSYFALYGLKGSRYGYFMDLSEYLVEDGMLQSLLGAVEVKEGGFGEDAFQLLRAPGNLKGMPESVLYFSELLSEESAQGYTGNRDFSYSIPLGNTVYTVPVGTIAVMDADEHSWKLYAFMQWYLSEVGDIRLFQVETEGKSIDDIVARYVGENYQKDCLTVNETAAEYRSREGNMEKMFIVDRESGNAIMVNRFAPGE